jgi:mono/diheme cytochrome c family protein
MRIRHRRSPRSVGGVLVSLLFASLASADDRVTFFETQIASVLAGKCVSCHQAGNAKGEFDLSTREGMLRGGDGGAGVVPGIPGESPVYTRSIPHDGQPP